MLSKGNRHFLSYVKYNTSCVVFWAWTVITITITTITIVNITIIVNENYMRLKLQQTCLKHTFFIIFEKKKAKWTLYLLFSGFLAVCLYGYLVVLLSGRIAV